MVVKDADSGWEKKDPESRRAAGLLGGRREEAEKRGPKGRPTAGR